LALIISEQKLNGLALKPIVLTLFLIIIKKIIPIIVTK
jgi:hypothetical protein